MIHRVKKAAFSASAEPCLRSLERPGCNKDVVQKRPILGNTRSLDQTIVINGTVSLLCQSLRSLEALKAKEFEPMWVTALLSLTKFGRRLEKIVPPELR